MAKAEPDSLDGGPMAQFAQCWLPAFATPPQCAAAAIDLTRLHTMMDDTSLTQFLPAALAQAAPRRKISFIGGRLCAARALAALSPHSEPQLTVGRTASGLPLWPAGFTGSISHHDQAAYAIAAPATAYPALGIDCEPVASAAAAAAIIAVCLSATEQALLARHHHSNAVATLIFSAKEAGFKALYQTIGRIIEFDEFETIAIDWHKQILWLAPVRTSQFHGMIRSFAVRFWRSGRYVHTMVAQTTDFRHPDFAQQNPDA